MDELVYGLDFGTSNTSLAVSDRKGPARLVPIDPHADPPTVLPTQLFFGRDSRGAPCVSHGAMARKDLIRQGVKGDGRFLFELKAVMGFPVRTTRLLGRLFDLEEVVASVVRFVKENADRAVGQRVRRVMCGLPVRFNDDPEIDARAEATLARALEIAGFEEHAFSLEPVAADAASGTGEAGVSVAVDIGGGTLDVSVVRRPGGSTPPEVLGVAGRVEAGRNVDRRLIDERLLLPFGRDLEWGDGHRIPPWVLTKVGAWSEFHLLADDADFRRALARTEVDSRRHPTVLALSRYFLERQGYSFVREVEARKIDLSEQEAVRVRFVGVDLLVLEDVRREHLGPVLEPLLRALDACLDEALARAGLRDADVTTVERIGGSARIPAIGERLAARFGRERVRGAGSLTAVALGLGELARQRFLG
ncbi:Hsp70 family protein [bacterium]|nr:Hsp70 family protein [bacterium]